MRNKIHNTVCIDRVTLAPYNTWSSDRTDWGWDLQNANHCNDEERTEKNDVIVIGEFAVQCIAEHVGTSNCPKYVTWWYGYGLDKDTEKQQQQILQTFNGRF